MKTFLDTHRTRSSCFMLYGNISNDTIWCGDLSKRTVEQYLVKLLKSRGYKHIIFFDDTGNCGAYCYDPVSARFFFADNKDKPIREYGVSVSEQGADNQVPSQQTASSSAGMPMGRNQARRRRRMAAKEESAEQTENQEEETSEAPSQPVETRKVRYALKSEELPYFVQRMIPLMNNADSHMALVFCDIFTNNFNVIAPLVHNITSLWDQYRISDDFDNICIILAPNTEKGTEDLISHLRLTQRGLAQQFLAPDGNGGLMLDPDTCFKIDLPHKDEVVNLLRRLSIVGTKRTRRRITFPYRMLDDLAAEILWCSRSCKSSAGDDSAVSNAEYMVQIQNRLESYINDQPGKQPLEITLDAIDEAWDKLASDHRTALEKLNRPGWERAYEVVSRAVKVWKASASRERQKWEMKNSLSPKPDWVVERLSTEPFNRFPRPKPPHFAILGSPGTGKRTIARLISDVLRENGILEVGLNVEVTRENLTSSLVAGTPTTTKECVERAKECVLFINKAHELGRKDVGEGRESTGEEVLSTLAHAMSSESDYFSLVLAGDEQEMRTMLNTDRDFLNCIGDNIIVIDDYGPEILEKILIHDIEEEGFRLDPELIEQRTIEGVETSPLSCFVSRIYKMRDRRRFGNGHVMERIAQSVCARTDDDTVVEECFYEVKSDGTAVDHSWFEPFDAGDSLDQIIAELDQLVGLDSVKEEVKGHIHRVRMNQERERQGLRTLDVGMHMVFTGNPGTGKTTVARLIGKIYRSIGILPGGQLVEVDRGDLVGGFSGHTALKTKEQIDKALGGVLFIDEAYALSRADGLGNTDSFGQEAIDTLNKAMEDNRDNLVVIAAGYPEEMDGFISSNEGLASRFKTIIEFPNYTVDECLQILEGFCDREEYVLTEEAREAARQAIAVEASNPKFSNGRFVRNLFEGAVTAQSKRLQSKSEYTREDMVTLTAEDFPVSEVAKGATTEELMAKLDELVGLENVKEEVKGHIHRVRMNQERVELGLPPIDVSMHMVFTGNPGTGKTTVARLIGDIYHSIGILPRGQLVEVDRGDLVGGFSGQTAIKTKGQIDRALGGVLFIDEAYALSKADDLGNTDSFGREAIDIILKAMEDNRDSLVVIAAGYTKPMHDFISSNEGLASRFKTTIEFPNYTVDECLQILEGFCGREQYVLTDEAREAARQTIAVEAGSPKFSNGRFVRNLFEGAVTAQSKRLQSMEGRTREDMVTLTAEDFPASDVAKGATTEELMAKLDELVGLESVKAEVKRHIKRVRANRMREKKGHKSASVSMHMVFTGNPGTGKTTVARLIGGIYHSIGLLPRGQLVEVDRGDLVGGYLGQTAIKSKEQIDKALGGVLFIDEAYMLSQTNALGEADSFGQEAIDTLNKAMEDNRDSLVVIAAGYTEPMSRFLKSNKGLASRFKTIIEFPNYTVDECLQILEGFCDREQYVLTDEAREAARQIIEKEITNDPNFSNGRFIRNLFEGALGAQASRLDLIDDPTDEDLVTLIAEDFTAK